MSTTTLTTFMDIPKLSGIDYRTDENRLGGFLKYLGFCSRTWDMDPSTKILPFLYDRYSLDTEERFWASFLYRNTYSTPGMWYIYQKFPWRTFDKAKFREWFYSPEGLSKITFSHDRWRAKHKTPDAVDSYISMLKHRSQTELFKTLTYNIEYPAKNFETFWRTIGEIYTFGTVTNFNYMETLHRVNSVNVDANRLLLDLTWKPRKGITYLLNGNFDEVPIVKLEIEARRICEEAQRALPDVKVNMLMMHRIFCLYGGLCIGNRYPRYYLDRNYEEMVKMEATDPELGKLIREAREKLFPHELLAEFGGWDGRQEHLLTTFRDEGRLVNIND